MIESLESRRLLAGFDDLLALATSGNSSRWVEGDFTQEGLVGFDDLLARTTPPGRWEGDEFVPMFASTTLKNGALMVQLGQSYSGDRSKHLRVTTSRSGMLRVFSNDQELIRVKAADVTSVTVKGTAAIDAVTLDESFPAAVVYLGSGSDSFRGNSRSNVVYGEKGNDTVYAGGGDDLVLGGEGNDCLFGERGNDTLDGQAHKDRIDGGKGKNELIGGEGTDTFTLRAKDKVRREARDHVKVIP